MNKMKLGIVERKILIELSTASSSLQMYTLFRRCAIEKSAFMKTIGKLVSNGMIDREDILVSITNKGLDIITKESKRLLEKPWREPLSTLLGEKRSRDSLYVPRRSLLSKEFHFGQEGDIL